MRTHKKFRCDACKHQNVTCNVIIDDYDLPTYLAICDNCGLKGSVKDSIREAIEDHQREANPKDAADIDWQQVNETADPKTSVTPPSRAYQALDVENQTLKQENLHLKNTIQNIKDLLSIA